MAHRPRSSVSSRAHTLPMRPGAFVAAAACLALVGGPPASRAPEERLCATFAGMARFRLTVPLSRQRLRAEEDEGEDWRVKRSAPPPAVGQLTSSDFIRHVRDGGPAAVQPEGLPPVDPQWIGFDEYDTARNVVNALCEHRFGEGVYVDRVIMLGDRGPAGCEYQVTLALTDRTIFGSCDGGQLQYFDRDTTHLVEQLKELDGWSQRIYKLKVQSPCYEKDFRIPEDLWKCEIFPCIVQLKGGRPEQYLNLVGNTTNVWRLADCKENREQSGMLTREGKEMRFTIEPQEIRRVSIHVDKKSRKAMEEARGTLREQAKKRRKEMEAAAKERAAAARKERAATGLPAPGQQPDKAARGAKKEDAMMALMRGMAGASSARPRR